MNLPGSRLRMFAARWCCPGTMERVVDPLIADLQREYAEARNRGRIWKGRSIQLAGWIVFLKVIVICAWLEMTDAERWTPDDRKSLRRAIVIAAVTAVVITGLLVSRSAEDYPKVLVHPSPKRLLFLAPYPFLAGIILGATLGIVLGLGGRALSRRLVAAAIGVSLLGSAMAFVDVGWVAPAARVAYRMTVGDTDPTTGAGEQSFGVLRQQIEQAKRDSAYEQFGLAIALSFDYHQRLALSLSPLVFGLFALAMAGCVRKRWLLGIATCATFFVYGWVVVARPWNIDFNWPGYAALWLPNVAIATLAAASGILSMRRNRAPRRQGL
jgi:lipopolysaccharide export system permease LptF/LptG-like protein